MMRQKARIKRGAIKVIRDIEGVACISATNGNNPYNINNRKEPKGEIFGGLKIKNYKRGTILRNLGIWGNGQN